MTKIGAGNLDRKITIQRFMVIGQNEFNEDVEDWTDFKSVRAQRKDVSERRRTEMMAAGQIGAFLATDFKVRSSSEMRTVTAQDRIVHEGDVWAIHSAPYEANDGRHRFIMIPAVKDADA